VAPSHSLRQVARALTARTLAAALVFFALAVALLAGTAAAMPPASEGAPEADATAAAETVELNGEAADANSQDSQPADVGGDAAAEGATESAAPAADDPAADEAPKPAAEGESSKAGEPDEGEAQLLKRGFEDDDDSDHGDDDESDDDNDTPDDDYEKPGYDYDKDDYEGESGDESGWTGDGGDEGGYDPDSGWVPGAPEGEGGKSDGWTAGPRVPHRTGAIGEAGGGGKGRGIAETPSLNSPVSSPTLSSPTEEAIAEQPADSPPTTPTSPPADAPPGTVQPDTILRDEGSVLEPVRTLRAGQPVGVSGAGIAGPDGASAGGTGSGGVPAPAAGAGAFDPVGESASGGDGSASPDRGASGQGGSREEPRTVVQTVDRLVNVVPDALKFALAALAALSVLLGFGYLMSAMRARSLGRQRRELLQEVGLLQSALLPPVPDRIGGLRTSVAYRPADGPGAGGDFYDVLALPGGRVGFILGDVSGHGRGALARTAFMRYTLRAYLEAGLEPRVALQVAGRVIDENLGGDFATVLLAVHDPDTGSLTYAAAGHPAPIVAGPQPHRPVTAASSPPIGVGVRTGLRQTTVPLVPGSTACLFTDGLMEARVDGRILGRERLEEILEELGRDASAHSLIDRVSQEARVLSDDIAAVVVSPTGGVTAGLFRTEQLELTARDLEGPMAQRFLESCGVPENEIEIAIEDATMLADRFGGAILHVVFGNRLRVEVLPRNVESIEAASRRAAAR
jgi:Stage II sporulation protein E (SpoIIE)